jgi:LysM repeat protein
MNILKIIGIVAGIHVVAFFLMFVNPGCRSTSAAPAPTVGDTLPAQSPAPAAADAGSAAAPVVSVSIPTAPTRYSPTRPGTPASEALETTMPNDVTPATTYTVGRGDSLSKIAKKNHTTVPELMKVNHLTNSSVLSVGKKLLIPGKSPSGVASESAEAPLAGGTYVVKPGDTLASIAHRTGSTTAELKQINHLRSDYVQVGRELKLPSGASSPAAEVAHSAPAATAAGSSLVKAPEGAVTHEVKPGETLGVIARKYHVKTQDILVANNIADPRKIRPGQNLVIPGAAASAAASSSTVSSSPAPAASPAPATAPADTSAPVADLDSGMKPQADVPVIKVDDGEATKTP